MVEFSFDSKRESFFGFLDFLCRFLSEGREKKFYRNVLKLKTIDFRFKNFILFIKPNQFFI